MIQVVQAKILLLHQLERHPRGKPELPVLLTQCSPSQPKDCVGNTEENNDQNIQDL